MEYLAPIITIPVFVKIVENLSPASKIFGTPTVFLTRMPNRMARIKSFSERYVLNKGYCLSQGAVKYAAKAIATTKSAPGALSEISLARDFLSIVAIPGDASTNVCPAIFSSM